MCHAKSTEFGGDVTQCQATGLQKEKETNMRCIRICQVTCVHAYVICHEMYTQYAT